MVGIPVIENVVHDKFSEYRDRQVLKEVQEDLDWENINVPEPQIEKKSVREAFTFALPPSPKWK
jgi:hypothetical protein